MCILLTATSPRGCCRKELTIQCHLDQFAEFLYAKAGRVVSDPCPKLTTEVTTWLCYTECKYMFHRKGGGRGAYWPADFNMDDDWDLLYSVQSRQQHYNDLANLMKREFTQRGAGDEAVAKAIQNLNNLPEDATLEDKAKEFASMGFKIVDKRNPKDST